MSRELIDEILAALLEKYRSFDEPKYFFVSEAEEAGSTGRSLST